MNPVVAAVDLRVERTEAVQKACKLIGGIDDIDVPDRELVVKVGVYTPAKDGYSTVDTVSGILHSFRRSPKRYIVESDNYQGGGMERLQIWRQLFLDSVVPVNLSQDTDTATIRIPNPIREVTVNVSRLILKPKVFVDTHVMRTYERGNILKNLFGLTPTNKKVQYHKSEIFYSLLTTLYEAIGGIDLAVLDATYFTHSLKEKSVTVQTDVLLVGRDAVAVETLGLHLAGIDVRKNDLIRSFVGKGLGVGDLHSIDAVGMSIEDLEAGFTEARKECMSKIPDAWSPSKAIDDLIVSGFFKSSKKRTIDEIVTALVKKDARTRGREKMIYANVKRRVEKGKLLSKKVDEETVFWT
ncbi:MAG: hypothetical protein C4K47_09370 [Candidatus Thorarchaeota archaeon]|nr:MAG: hypothetical protein C4K47_09370 [Candidatus Thorarchaeota archaeon]